MGEEVGVAMLMQLHIKLMEETYLSQHLEIYNSITSLQDRIIEVIAGKLRGDTWGEIVVSFEVEGEVGVEATHWIAFAVCEDVFGFKKRGLRFDLEDEDLFLELRKLYGMLGSSWSTVDIVLSPDGQFSFEFEHGPPKCLSGDETAMRRFEGYLEEYKNRHAKDAGLSDES